MWTRKSYESAVCLADKHKIWQVTHGLTNDCGGKFFLNCALSVPMLPCDFVTWKEEQSSQKTSICQKRHMLRKLFLQRSTVNKGASYISIVQICWLLHNVALSAFFSSKEGIGAYAGLQNLSIFGLFSIAG